MRQNPISNSVLKILYILLGNNRIEIEATEQKLNCNRTGIVATEQKLKRQNGI